VLSARLAPRYGLSGTAGILIEYSGPSLTEMIFWEISTLPCPLASALPLLLNDEYPISAASLNPAAPTLPFAWKLMPPERPYFFPA